MAGRGLDDGVLADVAPTLLEVLALAPWEGMTGRSLLVDGRLDIDGRLDR
jgi:bisphosphoglycerate-independent phosphoglycerate mutase (AlkP superfamily)